MKRKSSIRKLCAIAAVIILGYILCFVPMKLWIFDFEPFASRIDLGLDLKGGVYAVYEANIKDGVDEDFETAMTNTMTALEETLRDQGYTESIIQREGNNNIRVSVPGVNDPENILDILGSPAEIRFELRDDAGNVTETVLTGSEIIAAVAQNDPTQGPVVALKFNAKGSSAFYKATSENIGKKMYIVSIVDGVSTDHSAPTINDGIAGGQATITGMRNLEEAQKLASRIAAGKMSLTLTQKDFSTISATLGEGALTLGLIAGAIGLVLVIALIVYLYGLFGVVGGISLLIYTAMMVTLLAFFPWVQLTLPGIAGIILSIGMAIDGNVIIYERIKDEYREGKSILSAMYYGYRKSISAIADGNITTIIAAIVLWIFGTGPVKGFSMTLLMGIVLSMFCSLVVTRGLMRYFVNINQSNPKLYKLLRGEGFEQLSAEQNSPAVDLEIAFEKRRKESNSTPVKDGIPSDV